MGFLAAFFHLVNFIAPAAVLAPLLWLGGRFLMRKQALALVWWKQVAINFIAGCLVLLAGLVLLGRDGKMLTYAALVLVCATSQWACTVDWRRSKSAT